MKTDISMPHDQPPAFVEPLPPPLAQPGIWDSVAVAYAEELSPVFESYSRVALKMAGVRPGMHLVDIAAGPGTLVALVAQEGVQVTALDFSPGMIGRLRMRGMENGWQNVNSLVGNGMDLPFQDAVFDAAFSMFGLMFFFDRARGFAEMLRVLRPGCPGVISSWVPLSSVPLFAATMTILRDLLPDVLPEKPLPPVLTDGELCCREMRDGGFEQIEVMEHAATIDMNSMEDFVDFTLRTNAIVVHASAAAGSRWPAVECRLRQQLAEQFGPGLQTMSMTALITCGWKPAL